ncbi:hypothetical protein L3Q82_002277 [Scortum barcoo]|uniref:Uncharacterized protein n=1 Tax=Scortum barcoo TaxID=214431 RepID=A0ACB8W159_9TELE|nr:hypothetical protein L3Q82_002277 [Scortum barcoo]
MTITLCRESESYREEMICRILLLITLTSCVCGRVQFEKDVLRGGRIRLHVSRLRTDDSGSYQCEVKTNYGVDYAECRLNVTAIPFLMKMAARSSAAASRAPGVKPPISTFLVGPEANFTGFACVNKRVRYSRTELIKIRDGSAMSTTVPTADLGALLGRPGWRSAARRTEARGSGVRGSRRGANGAAC